jgi:hypothetical protein
VIFTGTERHLTLFILYIISEPEYVILRYVFVVTTPAATKGIEIGVEGAKSDVVGVAFVNTVSM